MTKKTDEFDPIDPDRPEDVIADAPAATPAPKVAKAVPPAPNYTDGPTAGKTHRILVYQDGGPDVEYLHDAPRDREVFIGGKPFDHANTTPDGTWVYRCDRKN